MKEELYVVENNELGYPRYLDGFKSDGSPVWKSDLQSIDPIIGFSEALGESKKCECLAFSVRVKINSNGVTVKL